MRDPARIERFLRRLATLWHKVPDWRFGQLISNVLGSYHGDIFFPEDEDMIEFMENWFKEELNEDHKQDYR